MTTSLHLRARPELMFSMARFFFSRFTSAPICSRIAARSSISRIEAFSGYDPARNVIGAHQLSRCSSEDAKAEPRQFVPGEVSVAAINALRSDRLRVKISRKNAQHAVNVRQIGPMPVKLTLQLIDDPGEFLAFLDQTGKRRAARES